MPGLKNNGPDCLSRFPVKSDKNEKATGFEEVEFASINSVDTDSLVVSWETVKEETEKDPVLQDLIRMICTNPSENKNEWRNCMDFYKFRRELSVEDGVILYGCRLVIPQSLQSKVLEFLHKAHQGVTGMGAQARRSIWWPYISRDIDEKRESCKKCDVISPSQRNLPPERLREPEF